MTCLTVFGASSGNIANAKVPFEVSTTTTGGGVWAPTRGQAARPASSRRHAASGTGQTRGRVLVCPGARGPSPSSGMLRCPARLADADPRTPVPHGASAAPRVRRPADILAPRDQIEVDQRPPPPVGGAVQRELGLFGRSRPDPAQAVGDAVHVRIDADVAAAVEAEDQH